MRVLVATTAGAGHLGPLVPFARAVRAKGHEVVVAAPASFAWAVERAGFAHHPFPDGSAEEQGKVFAGLAGVTNEEGNAIVIRDVFARIDARAALPGVTELVEHWRPDLVVRESAELASYIAAEAAGIPHVQVAVGLSEFEELYLPVLEEPLAELGSVSGVGGLLASPRLSLLPKSYDSSGGTSVMTTSRYREEARSRVQPLPDWWPAPDPPLVYVTFGSVAGGLGLFPVLYQQVVGALADLPVRVLLTTGEAADPELLGPLPSNVHVERWWPQEDVMSHASAIVGHGGFGTTLLGLASGVPMVVVPLFADQPYNAARVAAIGAGVALQGGPAAVNELAQALESLLSEEAYRRCAGSIADEIGRLPPVADCVPLLEAAAAGSR
jgi:UDP:flavonoid glycosyltransferase YjiC (YdhE family)